MYVLNTNTFEKPTKSKMRTERTKVNENKVGLQDSSKRGAAPYLGITLAKRVGENDG